MLKYLTVSTWGRILSKRAFSTLPRYKGNRNESLRSQKTTLAPANYNLGIKLRLTLRKLNNSIYVLMHSFTNRLDSGYILVLWITQPQMYTYKTCYSLINKYYGSFKQFLPLCQTYYDIHVELLSQKLQAIENRNI